MSEKPREASNTSAPDPIEQNYQDLKKKIESNRKLSDFVDSIGSTIKKTLSDPTKGPILRDFLKDPLVFENNPSQYTKLIEFIGIPSEWIEEFKGSDKDTRKTWSPEKLEAYDEWLDEERIKEVTVKQKIEREKAEKLAANQKLDEENARKLAAKQEKLNTSVALDAANQKLDEENARKLAANQEKGNTSVALDAANQKFDEENAQKLAANQDSETILRKQRITLEKARSILPELQKDLPTGEESKIQEFIQKNLGNPVYQLSADLKAKERQGYLRAVYFLEKGEEIRARLADEYKDKPNKEAVLSNFDTQLGELRKLDIVRQVSSKSFIRDFPPTPATETAIAQAEKYEKTHTVYRDGTSLYFVNKDNPKDIKKIEIFADRAILTVSTGGISLSTPMDLLSRDDAEKRREQRKLEEHQKSTEKDTSLVTNEFWNTRRNEYSNPYYSKTFLPEHRAKQIEYERLEVTLAQEPLKPKDKLPIIRDMKRLSSEMRDKRPEGIDPNDTDKVSQYNEVKSMLEIRVSSLGKLEEKTIKESEVTEQLSDKKFKDIKEIDVSKWENIAKPLLRILSDIGYDELGQDGFDRLIQGLARHNPNGLWKNGFQYNDTTPLRNQVNELRSISERVQQEYSPTGSAKLGWQNIAKQIAQDGSKLNTIWNSSQSNSIGNWAYGRNGGEKINPENRPNSAIDTTGVNAPTTRLA